MKNPVIFLAIFLSLILSSCHNNEISDYQSAADSIANKYAPDRRIDLCNIQVMKNNGSVVLKGETTVPAAKYALIKALSKHDIKLIDSIITLPDTSVNKFYNGLASLSVINLRKEPDYSAELVSQSLMGTPVTMLKKQGSWYLVRTPDRYIAWTESSSLVSLTKVEADDWKRADRVIYMKNTGWIYNENSEASGVISDIVAGDILVKNGLSGVYTKVSLPGGREGYIRSNDCMDFRKFCNLPPPDGEQIIKRAVSLLGIPYLWGGTSPKAADCSGFVQSIYFMNGILLMRDASLQALHGDSIDISNGFRNLKKGDLLFFGYKENGREHVIHAAIYMGNNDYINSAGWVMINSLDSTKSNFSSYRLNSLLFARRIIGAKEQHGITRLSGSSLYR
ncbi:MAG TPA: C40 family peptidase [Bacteroidales bacterium]|nr:C40 family peptidase [Bacteroidales bacterium]